ncbi:uncharacterized protein [Embiotoca jacksoni]|uniref:uncharacterized protein n=1 Tax=Embiotoca jacksoni TaxID=100190 RepID=UPI003703E056
MTASKCILQYYLLPRRRRLPFSLKDLVLIMTSLLSVTECGDLQIRGEVGGNVTFRCPVNKESQITFLYIQKDGSYVNGFHFKKITTRPWPNTIVDREQAAVHIYGLTPLHIGTYQCHIGDNKSHVSTTDIQLIVTATYSKPGVSKVCGDQRCLVICASHGGHPKAEMKWNVTGTGNSSSQMWKIVNSSEVQSTTGIFNSTSTAFFNCSGEEMKFSCSVGDITSDQVSVCAPKAPPFSPHVIAAAICLVVFFMVVVVVVWCWKYNARHRGAAAGDGVGQEEEAVALRESSPRGT